MKCSFSISCFNEEISSLSHILLSSISLNWSLRKAFLSLLAVLWNSAFRWIYFSFSLTFASLLFSAICKASSDNHLVFLHFFFLGMVLIIAFYPSYIHGILLARIVKCIAISFSRGSSQLWDQTLILYLRQILCHWGHQVMFLLLSCTKFGTQ